MTSANFYFIMFLEKGDNMQENNYEEENVLEKYGRNITELAKNNKIDPVIGRDEEIRSINDIHNDIVKLTRKL